MRASLDVQVAVSSAAREFVGRYHRGCCLVVPHAVRLPPAAEMRPERPPGCPVRLLFVGRLDEPRKGFAVLVDALRRLHGEWPGEYHLTAVGPGASGWQQAAAGLPVDFRGELTDHELGGAYAAADLVCVPSTGGESFGLVALEALAHSDAHSRLCRMAGRSRDRRIGGAGRCGGPRGGRARGDRIGRAACRICAVRPPAGANLQLGKADRRVAANLPRRSSAARRRINGALDLLRNRIL